MVRKIELGLWTLLAVLLMGAVSMAAENTDERQPPKENKKTVAPVEEKSAPEPPHANREEPVKEEPNLAPSKVRKEGPVEQKPVSEPSEVRRDGENRVSPTPTPLAPRTRSLPEPALQPPAPPEGNRTDQGGTYGGGNYGGYRGDQGRNYGYGGGSGSYGRTYNSDHDRWRYDRFRGSWDFLIFPGPVVYAPQPYYGPGVTGHVAGVHVEYSGDDATGSSFAGVLDDQLSENEMGPVASASDASLELYIISMEEEPTNPGYSSAVSVSYILMPENRFITAQLLDVGSEQIDALAASVVAYARQLLDESR